MITDQDNIESEIICHILGSFQNEDLCNYRFSKKEVMEYLEKCFGTKKQLADVLSDTTYYIREEKIETLEKQVEDMREAIKGAHEALVEAADYFRIDGRSVALNLPLTTAALAKLQPFLQ